VHTIELVADATEAYAPDAQEVHADALGSMLYVPTGHAVQLPAPAMTAENVPAAHAVQNDAPADREANKPRLHEVQVTVEVAPDKVLYCPAGHATGCVQSPAHAAPGAQRLHAHAAEDGAPAWVDAYPGVHPQDTPTVEPATQYSPGGHTTG